jgi:hypothetical protein
MDTLEERPIKIEVDGFMPLCIEAFNGSLTVSGSAESYPPGDTGQANAA